MDFQTFEFIRKKKLYEKGIVYVVTSKSFKERNIYKIGLTKTALHKRLSTLNTSHLIDDKMTAVYHKEFENIKLAEQMIHYILRDYRYSTHREFFEIDLETIKKCFEKVNNIFKDLHM